MNDKSFSEGVGSPRLPSASFARVDQASDQGQDLPPAPELCFRGFVCASAYDCRRAFECLGRLEAVAMDEVHADRAARRADQ